MRDLTKWPRLLVIGDPITPDQADEVILRTSCFWYLSGKDCEWATEVHRILGIETQIANIPARGSVESANERLGVLDLEYLLNSRISSSWIGGPHGWCNWDGTIGSANYNIGKWPSVEDVDAEWKKIAAAFPFLHLRAQLVPNEGESPYPPVAWIIEDGEAHAVEYVGLLCPPEEPKFDIAGLLMPPSYGRERGVSRERLEQAVMRVQSRR